MKPITLLSLLAASGTVITAETSLAQTYKPSDRIPNADNTLGTKVSGNGNNNFDITGGLNRGQTLFHSFTDFSIPSNGAANFINNPTTRDIITRVTGNNYSDINGKLNSNGANFLLINPNGVVFGPNVQLNVGKAFAASTATGVDLIDGNGGRYTFGTNGNGDAPLLSIDPNVFLNISRLNMGANLPGSAGIVNYGTLQTTNSGQYFGLIGGTVNLNGGKVIAPGGRIEIGGLVDVGSVNWGNDNNFPKLTFPAGVTRATVTLTDESIVAVADNGGGNITITAQNFNMFDGSQISAGISGSSANSQAGDIVIDVAQNTNLGRNKPISIKNEVTENGVENAGNINIKTQVLNISNGGEVSSITRGNGNGGNISIAADEINLFEDSPNRGSFANIKTDVVANPTAGDRQGGNIAIDTRRLNMTNNAHISAETKGSGRGGNLVINTANFQMSGGGYLSTNTFGKAAGGTLTVTANNLNIDGPSGISASAYDTGNAGDITIIADTFQIKKAGYLSTGTIGNATAGNLTVVANISINLDESSKIFAATFGSASAGNLTITTDTLQIKGGSEISASTYRGSGKAGDLTVKANTVEIDGESPNTAGGFTSSGLLTQVDPDGKGNAGTLKLNTQKLTVSNGGKVQAATFGKGNGGSVFITADEIDVFNAPGVTPKQTTNINAGVSFNPQGNLDKQGNPVYAEGNAGNLSIDTRRLSIRNGAAISSDTQGKGNGGQLAITATESVSVVGAGSTVTVGVSNGAVGNGGELKLKTPQLVVTDGGTISTSSAGTGVAGKLTVNAKTIDLRNRGAITGETRSGQGGNIELNASDYLLMRQNSRISATAGTAQQGGDGGNIKIITPFIMALSGNNDITANAYTGNGGKVMISSDGLFGIEYRANGLGSDFTSDITASSTFGQSGTVNIEIPGTDPGKDSTELPNATTDASNQISQACSAETRQNKLTLTGRGGMQPNANDPLTADVIWQDPRTSSSQPAVASATNHPTKLAPPAVGMVFDGKGKVTLIAAGTPGQPTGTSVTCPNVAGN